MTLMTLNKICKKCNSIDVLIGWQGPDLVEAGCAIAYISGANDLCVRGAIHADIVGVEHRDGVILFGYAINIDNNGNGIDGDEWQVWRAGFMNQTAQYIAMYRGNERIGDAVLFEVER